MQKSVNSYLERARQDSSRNFNNANGDQGMPTGRVWQGAGGQQGAAATSQPWIIQISNASAGAISNFDIFGALTYLNTGVGTWSNGNWTYQNVTVSSYLPGISYQFMVGQSNQKPFGVAQTMLQLVSGNAVQINTPVSVYRADASGNIQQSPIVFPFNTFQQITTQTVSMFAYTVDGNVSLRFTAIQAATVFLVYIYPYAQADLTNAINGGGQVQAYQNPGVNGLPLKG